MTGQVVDPLRSSLPPARRWLGLLATGGLLLVIARRLVAGPPNGGPAWPWHLMRWLNQRLAIAQAPVRRSDLVLLLTTTGRKTGRPHVTPLQYERVNGQFLVGAARGPAADWYRNLLAQPRVEITLGEQCFTARAEPLVDPARIADFLQMRLRRHPLMVRAMLLLHGIPPWADRRQLENLASRLALVVLQPERGVALS